jgi:ubiquitin-like modifier-activating enzyme ATG7
MFEDCADGGRHKAKAAAEMAKRIFPGVEAAAVDLGVPMPGHPFSDSLREQMETDFKTLKELVMR